MGAPETIKSDGNCPSAGRRRNSPACRSTQLRIPASGTHLGRAEFLSRRERSTESPSARREIAGRSTEIGGKKRSWQPALASRLHFAAVISDVHRHVHR